MKTRWIVSSMEPQYDEVCQLPQRYLVHVKNAKFLWALKTTNARLARTEAKRLTAEAKQLELRQ